jgi:predicted membrane protein
MARRAETQNQQHQQQQQQRTWILIFSYTVMIPITDSRSRMWRCLLAIGLLSFFLSLFLSCWSVCLFVSFFFFLREYLALFLSLLLCCGVVVVVVVSRPVWYYKDTRARHKVMEGKQRSQKRVQKSTKAPKTVLRTRHPVTTPFIAPVLSHLFSLFPVSIKKSPVATIT